MILWVVWSELLKSFSILRIWKCDELPKVGQKLKEIYSFRCVQIVSDEPPPKNLQEIGISKADIQIPCRAQKYCLF